MKAFPLALFTLLAASALGQDKATFSSPELGLSFEHPKSWKVAKQKNKKDIEVTIPLDGKTEPAKLEIYTALFKETPEHWELIQQQVNKQLKRDVVRQWREEILSVPLLLTRVSYLDKGSQRDVLTGILYSATPRKLLFRLTAASGAYDDAEFQFREAMQTLKTMDGKLPEAEDPERTVDPTEYTKPATAATKPPRRTVLQPVNDKKKIEIGPVSQTAKAGGNDVTLHVPEGWSIQPGENTFALKHAAVPGEVRISVASVLDSQIPEQVMLTESGKTLELFTSITKRQENAPVANKAGATYVSIWRTGVGQGGELCTIEAYGLKSELYWIATYRTNGKVDKAAEAALRGLFLGASVEPAK